MRRETTFKFAVVAGLLCGVCLFWTSDGSHRYELEEAGSSDPQSPPPKVLDCGPDGTSCNLNGGGDHYARKQQSISQNSAQREGRWVVNSLFARPSARRGRLLPPRMIPSSTLWGFDNNKYGAHSDPGKQSADYQNYQRSAGARHHTISDIGTWWGDNNAWYDGWEAHRADVNQPPRWWDKDFDGYKSYVRDLERDMPDAKWRDENINMGDGDPQPYGEGVAMNDDESFERERMARTYDDAFMYGPEWKDKAKIYYGMTDSPSDDYPGYNIQGTKEKGSKGDSAPPWCDYILGCQGGISTYTDDGELMWNTEPDDPHDSDSYVTNWYRINQAR